MSRQNRLLLLSCSLLLSAMAVAEAEAQGLPPPFIEYAAKFTCGRVPPAGPAGGGDTDAVVGVYATSINIHNPQAETPITFFKKIVIANQEGQTPGQIFVLKATETLGPDRAERVDCPLIFRLPGITPGTHVEGFVVLEIAVNPNQPQVSLDVVGTYSARAFTGEAEPRHGRLQSQGNNPIAEERAMTTFTDIVVIEASNDPGLVVACPVTADGTGINPKG